MMVIMMMMERVRGSDDIPMGYSFANKPIEQWIGLDWIGRRAGCFCIRVCASTCSLCLIVKQQPISTNTYRSKRLAVVRPEEAN